MKSAGKNDTKKQRGRPATGQGVQIGTRWPENTIASIDAWASSQDDEPGRSEAIRRLVEIGLSKSTPTERPRVLSTAKQGAARAAELAAKTIDWHIDPRVPAADKETRKRKLVEGPSVFRDARKDGRGK